MGGTELVVMIASKCGVHRVINDSTIEHRKSLITPNDSCNLYGDRGSLIKSLDDDSLTVESKITIACKKVFMCLETT